MRRFRFKLEKLLELGASTSARPSWSSPRRPGAASPSTQSCARPPRRGRGPAARCSAGAGLEDFRAAELYIVRLDRERDRLTEELALAELEREKARLDYVERHNPREAIEKLKERRQAEYYRLAEREETKPLDDLARRR